MGHCFSKAGAVWLKRCKSKLLQHLEVPIRRRLFSKPGAKVLLFFEMTKYFWEKMQKKGFFLLVYTFFTTFVLSY